MKKVVFLLEEESMEHLLRGVLPRIVPDGVEGDDWVLIPHRGKSDLEQSIPRKLRAWREPGTRFFIIRDQDSANCVVVKERLRGIAKKAKRADTVVRIACRELEAWYFGDLEALANEYSAPEMKALKSKSGFREPDKIGSPANELEKRLPEFGKTDAARRMGHRLSIDGTNTSSSFTHVLRSIRSIFES